MLKFSDAVDPFRSENCVSELSLALNNPGAFYRPNCANGFVTCDGWIRDGRMTIWFHMLTLAGLWTGENVPLPIGSWTLSVGAHDQGVTPYVDDVSLVVVQTSSVSVEHGGSIDALRLQRPLTLKERQAVLRFSRVPFADVDQRRYDASVDALVVCDS